MFPKTQAMAQDSAIISQEHRSGSEENPLSPTLASLEWKEQDSMPMSQQQRQQLPTIGPEGPSSGPGQTASVRLSFSKPPGSASPAQSGARQPIGSANARARQNRPQQWRSPSSQLAQLCVAAGPRLRAETGIPSGPRLSRPVPRGCRGRPGFGPDGRSRYRSCSHHHLHHHPRALGLTGLGAPFPTSERTGRPPGSTPNATAPERPEPAD